MGEFPSDRPIRENLSTLAYDFHSNIIIKCSSSISTNEYLLAIFDFHIYSPIVLSLKRYSFICYFCMVKWINLPISKKTKGDETSK